MREQSAWLAAKETGGKEHAWRVPFLTAFAQHQQAGQRYGLPAQCSLVAVGAAAGTHSLPRPRDEVHFSDGRRMLFARRRSWWFRLRTRLNAVKRSIGPKGTGGVSCRLLRPMPHSQVFSR